MINPLTSRSYKLFPYYNGASLTVVKLDQQ
jgi:hypothetical protein